ncbi:cold-shock protein, partial [Mesorhizobium intechi]
MKNRDKNRGAVAPRLPNICHGKGSFMSTGTVKWFNATKGFGFI